MCVFHAYAYFFFFFYPARSAPRLTSAQEVSKAKREIPPLFAHFQGASWTFQPNLVLAAQRREKNRTNNQTKRNKDKTSAICCNEVLKHKPNLTTDWPLGQIDKILTRTQLEKIQILYVLQFAGISCARSIYFTATNQNFVRMLYLLCGNKRVFCAYCMRFFVFFCSSPHSSSTREVSKPQREIPPLFAHFQRRLLNFSAKSGFGCTATWKNKTNKQEETKTKKRHNAALHLGKGIFFFFQASPASHPPFSPCQLWPHSGGEVAWGGVGGGWVPQCPWRWVEHLHAPFGAKGGQGHPVPPPATQVGRCICWRRQQNEMKVAFGAFRAARTSRFIRGFSLARVRMFFVLLTSSIHFRMKPDSAYSSTPVQSNPVAPPP